MLKNDYLKWVKSKPFPIKELHCKFQQMVPFSHNNIQHITASNRLFDAVIENAMHHKLIGHLGISSIRIKMSMNELLFNILTVASPVALYSEDVNYYLNHVQNYSEQLKPCIVNNLLNEIDIPKIVWIQNNINNPTTLTCRILTTQTQQDLFTVHVIINSNGYYELDL